MDLVLVCDRCGEYLGEVDTKLNSKEQIPVSPCGCVGRAVKETQVALYEALDRAVYETELILTKTWDYEEACERSSINDLREVLAKTDGAQEEDIPAFIKGNVWLRRHAMTEKLHASLKELLRYVEESSGMPLSELYAKGDLPSPVQRAYSVVKRYDEMAVEIDSELKGRTGVRNERS